jgi:hypothetical protein
MKEPDVLFVASSLRLEIGAQRRLYNNPFDVASSLRLDETSQEEIK